jgi:hypothetical protein
LSSTLNLRIGAMQLVLDIGQLSLGMRADMMQRYAAFVDDLPSTSTAFRLAVAMRPGAPWLPQRADALLPLRTRRRGQRVSCLTPTEAGSFDLAQRRGRIVLRPHGNVENCLRVLVGWDVAQRGGLLLHACGVVRQHASGDTRQHASGDTRQHASGDTRQHASGDTRQHASGDTRQHASNDARVAGAFVFFGPSGAGKSTVATLSARWPVLSDDLVLIERTATGFQACGVPFRGNEWTAPRLNTRAPLAGLLALEQAPHHARLPLSHGAGAARLVACTPFVTTCPHGAALVMGAALALTRITPVARLQFRKDDKFWEVLQ